MLKNILQKLAYLTILIQNLKSQTESSTTNNQKQPDNKEYVLLEDLQIKSPLKSDKRFLGWYVDGEWEVKDKQISFMNYKEKSFLITNNLILKSSKVYFKLNITVVQDFDKSKKSQNGINSDEVMVFSLSPNLYPIKTFDQFSTKMYLDGYCVFMFRQNGKSYLFLDQVQDYANYDLQLIFNTNLHDDRTYCEIDYLNKDSQINFFLDFDTGNFHVFFNDKNCISYRINQRLFYENKAALTITGYSSQRSPVQMKLNELSVFKQVYIDNSRDKESFHSSIDSFSASMDKYNPLHKNTTSLSNILLIQGKIKKELLLSKDVLELLTLRTDNIGKQLENEQLKKNTNSTNIFFEDEEYVGKLEKQITSLETIVTNNDGMEVQFKELVENFDKVNDLFSLIKEVDDINDYLGELDQLVEVRHFDEYLDELNQMSAFLEKKNSNLASSIKNVVNDKLKGNFEIGGFFKFLSVFLVLIIFVLVWMIVRKVNERMKNSLF